MFKKLSGAAGMQMISNVNGGDPYESKCSAYPESENQKAT